MNNINSYFIPYLTRSLHTNTALPSSVLEDFKEITLLHRCVKRHILPFLLISNSWRFAKLPTSGGKRAISLSLKPNRRRLYKRKKGCGSRDKMQVIKAPINIIVFKKLRYYPWKILDLISIEKQLLQGSIIAVNFIGNESKTAVTSVKRIDLAITTPW